MLTKNGDIPTNVAIGPLIGALNDYFALISKNGGGGTFIYRQGKQNVLIAKEQFQITLVMIGLGITITGSVVITVYTTKKLFRICTRAFKRLRRKPLKKSTYG